MARKKIEFRNNEGHLLAGSLELPEQVAKGYVLFAHCFTCGKDIGAASRIARQLAQHGFATLRFDFTGLGNSDGDFANTNFSSNVEDLIAAADFLRAHYQAPLMLIGHSLGGAAVLAAAEHIPEAKAIVTIGAPAAPAHVAHNFAEHVQTIDQQGVAEVNLMGRVFTIKKHFLDDIRELDLAVKIKQLNKALLVFHSPVDDTVNITEAGKIFSQAKHPKSFISLDDADHLLRKPADAEYVAATVNAWIDRYLHIE